MTQVIVLGGGAVSELVMMTSASDAVSGLAFGVQPVLEFRDSVGNLVSVSDVVTLSVSDGGSVVGSGSVAAVGGVVSFSDVGIAGLVGSYTLTFSSGGLSVTQVIALEASDSFVGLRFVNEPASVASGELMEPVVIRTVDVDGNFVPVSGTALLSLTDAQGGARPSGHPGFVGTAVVMVDDGIASFTDLKVDEQGTYTLTVTVNGIMAVSSPFSVSASVDHLALTGVSGLAGDSSGSFWFVPPEGLMGVEFALVSPSDATPSDADWTAPASSTDSSIRVAPLSNGEVVCVRLRGIFADDLRGPASPAVCMIPAAPPEVHQEPNVTPSFAPSEEVARVTPREDGVVVLTFTYTLTNNSGADIESLWLRPWSLPAGMMVTEIVSADQHGEIVSFPWIENRWYWSGANLDNAEAKSLLVTVEITGVHP